MKKTFTKKINNKETITATLELKDLGQGDYFSITGEITTTRGRGRDIMFGCIHDEILEHFPQLADCIPFHCMNVDTGPMHYVANTLYHARDRSDKGFEIGEATAFEERLKIGEFSFKFDKDFHAWIQLQKEQLTVIHVPYDGTSDYTFSDNFSFDGFDLANRNGDWYKAPFKTSLLEAEEMKRAIEKYGIELVRKPTSWCVAVEPDIESARSCANWPDATLAQLQSEDTLLERLPKLLIDLEEMLVKYGFRGVVK